MTSDPNMVAQSTNNAGASPAPVSATTATSRQTSTPASSRRASQIYPMDPPPLPLASPAGAPSAMNPFPPLSPGQTSTEGPHVPVRYPRQLTPAELHLELEKEQEAVVNRLTRELTALRAHSNSIASTTSSTTSSTALLLDATDPSSAHAGALNGPTHPTASRRHRSSSSVSRTSQSANSALHTPASLAAPNRYSISSQPGSAHDVAPPRSASQRYEEVVHSKQDWEEMKRENEALKLRVRELERAVREQRRSSSADTQSRGRSQRAIGNTSSGISEGAKTEA